MNEVEQAELFNKELDALLEGGQAPALAPDQGAMDLAAELARMDFSGESAIKESLRRQLAGEAGSFLPALRALFSNNYVRTAFAAALAVIALLPLARRQEADSPAAPAGLTAELPPVPVLPLPARLPEPPVAARPAGTLFASLPMPRLEAEPIKEFPIARAGSGLELALAEGRPITRGGGPGIVLETESAPFPIERRPIKPGDLFERRVL